MSTKPLPAIRGCVAASLLGLSALTLPQTAYAQAKIGVAAAARNDVVGIVGGARSTLAAGSNVFANEVVRTGENSLAQLLFLDQTTFSVAARSEVRLDRFVYNPKPGFGRMVLRAVQGVFRFVSGVQSPGTYRIQTPLASLVVRGTIVDILVSPARVVFLLDEGSGTVTANGTGQSVELTTPGTAVVVWADGRVTGPFTWDGTIIKINGNVPFPLFGATIWPAQPSAELPPDSRRDLVDQLTAIGAGGCPPGTGAGGGICAPPVAPPTPPTPPPGGPGSPGSP